MTFPVSKITAQYARVEQACPANQRMKRELFLFEYMSLLVEKVDQVGQHYVTRQMAWAEAELDRLELAA